MKPTTRLKQLVQSPELLVMPGAFDPISARMIEAAGFDAIQCTGLGIAASHLGLPDVSTLGMSDVIARTGAIARSVSIPVMADADTGFGNAVNVWFTVKGLEAAGAAGVNLEDQIMPKRCGHLDGKEIVSLEEMVGKLQAAADARLDPDFVLNARTDALAVAGMAVTIRRGNAYLQAGATMIFVDGAHDRDVIRTLVREIAGPVGINMVEGGKTPAGLTFAELREMGVARVSLPLTPLIGAMNGIARALREVRERDGLPDETTLTHSFNEAHALVGMDQVYALERRFLPADLLQQKYDPKGAR